MPWTLLQAGVLLFFSTLSFPVISVLAPFSVSHLGVWVCVFVQTCASVHVCVYACVYACMQVKMCVLFCVQVCTYLNVCVCG